MSASRAHRSILAKAFRNPGRALAVGISLLKGHGYRWWYAARGRRVRMGRNFRVNGSLNVRGPGEVVFGDNVLINGQCTPWTYETDARIVIGNNVILSSTRFGCVQEIIVGDDCLLASAAFTDTDYHSARADRRSPDASAPVRVAPIRLGRNVWIGENAGILPGTVIGENSVVGFGAICMRPYPANVVILGNPGKVVGPIPDLPSAPDHPVGVAPPLNAQVLTTAGAAVP